MKGTLIFYLEVLKESLDRFLEEDMPTHAAALSYNMIFSLPSMLLIVLWVAAIFYGEVAVGSAIFAELGSLVGEDGAQQIMATLDKLEIHEPTWWASTIALLVLLFFALVPYWGQAVAAAAVGGTDLLIAIILVAYASSLKPAPELEMIREMREFAIADLQDEVVKAENELVDLRNDVKRFVRNPVDALMPGIIGPLLGSVTRGLKSK